MRSIVMLTITPRKGLIEIIFSIFIALLKSSERRAKPITVSPANDPIQ
jgi:hypothetical protein